ncbi:ferredoxin [Nocardia gipuzkoensis]|uniref:ferredoxin n=1 Tax=Nocardia gipuzkoensis TaxID=2749991 RepID=UPI001E46A476|nr:ferredoxin [Nocardia gipuzkoensis]UGT68253.1 ferredoxin [Nocardia gipuzkoensis]
MRIRLDRTLCDGFGLCAKHAPAHFSLDDWGYATMEGTGVVAAADQDGVLRALLDCPVHAIIALPEPETGPPPATSAPASAAEPLGQEPPR